MEFKEYSSIENSYRQKNLDKHLEYNPKLANMTYIVREKLDGANIQLLFQPHSDLQVGKRSGWIANDEDFFDIWGTLDRYSGEITQLQNTANLNNISIRVFGELYGKGIQKRIDYGPEKYVKFFDIYVGQNDEERLLSQADLSSFLASLYLSHMLPTTLALYPALKEAIDDSLTHMGCELEFRPCEGVVIQPYSEVVRSPNGARFILKKKAAAFEDKEIKPKIKIKAEGADVVEDLNLIFKTYLTKNRVLDVYSKHGEIKEMSQIGDYIKLILEDAKVDFLKDNTIPEELTSQQKRDIFNAGGVIVQLIKETV